MSSQEHRKFTFSAKQSPVSTSAWSASYNRSSTVPSKNVEQRLRSSNRSSNRNKSRSDPHHSEFNIRHHNPLLPEAFVNTAEIGDSVLSSIVTQFDLAKQVLSDTSSSYSNESRSQAIKDDNVLNLNEEEWEMRDTVYHVLKTLHVKFQSAALDTPPEELNALRLSHAQDLFQISCYLARENATLTNEFREMIRVSNEYRQEVARTREINVSSFSNHT